jgi:hypothetical protein
MSGRSIYKSWKNGKDERGRYKPFTRRIRWYQGAEENDIRLHLETEEYAFNVYPSSQTEAEQIFTRFKNGDDIVELNPILRNKGTS